MRTIIFLTFCLALSACKESAQTEVATSTEYGWVVLTDTLRQRLHNADMSGTRVTVEGTGISALSDYDGYFTLNNVPEGRQTYIFKHEGYITQMVANSWYMPSAVELFPVHDYRAEITNIEIVDTTVTGTRRVGVVVGPRGDTLDYGHDTVVTAYYEDYMIRISGKIFRASGNQLFWRTRGIPKVYLFFATTPNFSVTDPKSWKEVFTNEIPQQGTFTTVDSAYGSAFEMFLFDWEYYRSQFKKGEPVYCFAFASPYIATVWGKNSDRYFPALENIPASPTSFTYPW